MEPTADDLFIRELRRDELLDDLDRLLVRAKDVNFAAESARQHSGQPAAGSTAATDAASVPDGMAKLGQLRVLPVWVAAAAEQLRAVAAAHHFGAALFGPPPLLRSVLELSARTCWVLDAEDANGRFERGWLMWLISFGQDAKTARIDTSGQVLGGADERLRQLRDETIPGLFGYEPNCKGQPIHWTLGETSLPGFTDTIGDFLQRHVSRPNGQVAYRIASMLAHPTASGAMLFASTGASGEIELEWSADHVAITSVSAMTVWGLANRNLLAYFGWEAPAFEAWWEALLALQARLGI
jgi:hypothetical protein